jgi:hypothetical protein
MLVAPTRAVGCPMEVAYTLTINDLVRVAYRAWKSDRNHRIAYYAWWAILTVLIATGAAALSLRDDEWQLIGWFLALLAVTFAAVYPFSVREQFFRRTRAALRRADLRGIVGRIALILTDETLTEVTDVTRSEARWADMLGVDAGEDYTIIQVTAALNATLPRRGFDSDEEYRAVRDFAVARIKPRNTNEG